MNAPLPVSVARAVPGGQHAQPEIAAFGEWDTANLGDRGIHAGVLQFFAGCGWGVRSYGISSLAPAPRDAAQRGIPPAAGGGLRAILEGAPSVKRALRGARQKVRVAALSPALERSQAILVGGGALLSDANLHFPQSLVELARCARRLGKPLLCLGCSVEGEWSARGEQMIREFLAACSVVAVRDEATAARLAAVLGGPPPVFGDFCLSEALVEDGDGRDPGRGDLAVNVCQLSGPWASAQERYEEALVALVRRLAPGAAQRGAGIRIFTTGLPEDARAAGRVFAQAEAAGAQLYLPCNLAQLSAMLRSSAVVVSTRLHAAVLALAERVPVVGLSVTPKLRDFLSTLGIRRHFHDLAEGPQLASWLATADYEALFVEQRRALVRAPVWAGRARVRDELNGLAGAVPCK